MSKSIKEKETVARQRIFPMTAREREDSLNRGYDPTIVEPDSIDGNSSLDSERRTNIKKIPNSTPLMHGKQRKAPTPLIPLPPSKQGSNRKKSKSRERPHFNTKKPFSAKNSKSP